MLLELLDLTADGALRDQQLLGRAAEGPAASRCREYSQAIERRHAIRQSGPGRYVIYMHGSHEEKSRFLRGFKTVS
jgi:hypothetical protein